MSLTLWCLSVEGLALPWKAELSLRRHHRRGCWLLRLAVLRQRLTCISRFFRIRFLVRLWRGCTSRSQLDELVANSVSERLRREVAVMIGLPGS